jgi:hypothetical protein
MEPTADEAVRFCGECRKNVYNVAQMKSEDASLLLQQAQAAGGSACMQLYRRADGTVITDDCPVGLRRVRDFWRKVKSAAAAIALVAATLPAFAQDKDGDAGNKTWAAIKGGIRQLQQPLQLQPPEQRMAGGVTPINWRDTAMAVPSVKQLADRVEAMQKKQNLSHDDKIKIVRMRMELAKESQKANVPYFALAELEEVQNEVEHMSASGNAGWRRERTELLIDILKARKSNQSALNMSDVKALDAQIQKLESQR